MQDHGHHGRLRLQEGRVSLALAALVLLGLVVAIGWLVRHESEGERAPVARALAAAPAAGPADSSDPAPELGSRARAAASPSPQPAPPEALAPAILSGRLQINGFAPYDGRVRLRQEEGDWEGFASIDPHGRFYVEDVPPARIRLAFEAESLEERQLVLPSDHPLTLAPGATELVDLDWRTRHVNVQVVTDLPVKRAHVELAGPSYRTSFETNEAGKARLALVGFGTFTFRARLASGQSGEAELELEEGDELDTVAIAIDAQR